MKDERMEVVKDCPEPKLVPEIQVSTRHPSLYRLLPISTGVSSKVLIR